MLSPYGPLITLPTFLTGDSAKILSTSPTSLYLSPLFCPKPQLSVLPPRAS